MCSCILIYFFNLNKAKAYSPRDTLCLYERLVYFCDLCYFILLFENENKDFDSENKIETIVC